ncbi:hypothetical protein, partial, partial [Parasitella parasitica]
GAMVDSCTSRSSASSVGMHRSSKQMDRVEDSNTAGAGDCEMLQRRLPSNVALISVSRD